MAKKKKADRKYRVREILDQLPYNERKTMFAELVKKLSIHPNALHRIMAIKATEKSSISVDKMKLIAEMLGVSIDDLVQKSKV